MDCFLELITDDGIDYVSSKFFLLSYRHLIFVFRECVMDFTGVYYTGSGESNPLFRLR